jgi:signal transduction histidine kinase
MTHLWIVPFVAALANVSLAAFVIRTRPRTEIKEIFAFTNIALAFWNCIYIVLYYVKDYDLAFSLSRLARSGALFLFPAVLHLAISVPQRPRSRYVMGALIVNYVLFTGLVVANAFDLLVPRLRIVPGGYYSLGSSLYNFFSVLVVLNFVAVLALLASEYRRTTEVRTKLQLKFWLIGLGLALPLGLTNLFPVYGIPIYPLGNLGSAVWAGIVAYAIVRHRLMDVDVFVAKSIAYAVGGVLVLGPIFYVLVLMQRWTFGEINYDFSIGTLVLLLLAGVIFPALRARAEVGLSRSLFREKYQSRSALSEYAHSILRILDRDRLVSELCKTLYGVFNLDRVSMFLFDGVRGQHILRFALGVPPDISRYAGEHAFARWLRVQGEPVLWDEATTDGGSNVVVSVFQANGWEVAVPLISGERLIGFIGLGRKGDLGAFGAVDLGLLRNVGAEASIALENARLYAELRQSQEMIDRSGRLSALGTLAAGIAHEIRNPLVSIQTFLQLAPRRLDDEEFMTSFLPLAEAEVQRIASLIGELLTFAKSAVVNVREINVDEIVDRTITLATPQARAERVELGRAGSVAESRVLADADQILQVLLNIVLNGIQATPVGGSVTIETRQVEVESGLFCQVEVRDTGPGVPPEIREAIFNPFFTTKDKGTGLGLPIAHRIIAECGGFIELESVQGEGARFFVNLPVAELREMRAVAGA